MDLDRTGTVHLITGLAAATVLVAACGSSASPTSSTAAATIPPTTTTSTTAASPSTTAPPATGASSTTVPTRSETEALATEDPLPGRLVVLGTTGGLSASQGDGFVPLEVASGGFAQQPTWAPGGESIAWAEFDASGAAVVAIGRANGSEVTRYEAPFGPFYFYWSPDASRLAFLGGNPIGLGLLDIAADSIEVVDMGQPYYFDWSPDGAELVTHIGGEGLSVGSPGGAPRPIEPNTGAFLAPEWIPGQAAIVYVRALESEIDDGTTAAAGTAGFAAQTELPIQQLVRLDLDGGEPSVLVEFSGRISFDVSPDGAAIAFSVTRGAEPLNFGPLTVLDFATGEQRSISPGPVLAYEWSPDSTALALLSPTDDQLAVRWGVGAGAEIEWFPPFIPTSVYTRAYLPFFDQYARSSTMWSPDGSAIVFTAIGPEGDEVWLQSVTGGDPAVLGPGSFASFAGP